MFCHWLTEEGNMRQGNTMSPGILRRYVTVTIKLKINTLKVLFQLPAIFAHAKLLLRLVIVVRKKSDNKPHILVSEKTSLHLPTCEINPSRSIHSTLKVIFLFKRVRCVGGAREVRCAVNCERKSVMTLSNQQKNQN